MSRCPTTSHRVPPAGEPPALSSRGRAAFSLSDSPIFSRNGEPVLLQSTKADELSHGQSSSSGTAATSRPPRAWAGTSSLTPCRTCQGRRVDAGTVLGTDSPPIAPWQDAPGVGWRGKQRPSEWSGGCGGSLAAPPAACVGTPRHPASPGGTGGDYSELTQVSGCRRHV